MYKKRLIEQKIEKQLSLHKQNYDLLCFQLVMSKEMAYIEDSGHTVEMMIPYGITSDWRSS